MPPPEELVRLVARFSSLLADYNAAYNEATVRRQFIEPFFKILGWDMLNESGQPESEKEVLYEYSLKVGESHKAPDYCFRIGKRPIFFVEAKKPSVDIEVASGAAFQLRRYGWSAELSVSILTNFRTLAIYSCRRPPRELEPAKNGLLFVVRFDELVERWDEVEDLLSRQSVIFGSLERLGAREEQRKGTVPVGPEFLAEIENWRAELARVIALRNEIDVSALNSSVQQIIDRIIFLRICEDRGIEKHGQLLSIRDKDRVYEQLVALFKVADHRYNSGLFHFDPQNTRRTPVDTITPSLEVDDGAIRTILRTMYFPKPYEFSVFSADLLGRVYEQFLGKVIRLTETGQAKIDSKPDVRKAGGVYYTPGYVVEAVVEETLKPTLEKLEPISAPNIRILDPACGSGSFLIQAYQYILDWYCDWLRAALRRSDLERTDPPRRQ